MEGNELVIVLKDMDSVPQVYLHGEEVTYKAAVKFDWGSKNGEPGSGNLTYEISHYDQPPLSRNTVRKEAFR